MRAHEAIEGAGGAAGGGGEQESTRTRLISAAEVLFARHGIDGVSLREINRESGARNAVALQYHFQDRDGVLRAILAKHRPSIEAARHAMLDEVEAQGDVEIRPLAAALVRPLAAKLEDPNGGPEYLQIQSELLNRHLPRLALDDEGAPLGASTDDSIQRWRAMVAPLLEQDATRLHRRFTAMRFTAAELGRRAASGPHADHRLFVSHLIDLVAALLVAPTSPETIRLADARDASRRARTRRR